MRGGIYARLEIKNAIERTYNLTQPPQRRRQVAGSAEGKVAPRIHTRVPEQGRDSRRGARFNHRTGSAAAEGEREREGERVKERERGIKKRRGECMHEAPEKGAGASNGRAVSQVAEPTPTACDIAPFIHAALFTAQHAHTHASPLILPLSLSLSLPPSRSLFPTVAAEPAQSSLFLVPRCSRSH